MRHSCNPGSFFAYLWPAGSPSTIKNLLAPACLRSSFEAMSLAQGCAEHVFGAHLPHVLLLLGLFVVCTTLDNPVILLGKLIQIMSNM